MTGVEMFRFAQHDVEGGGPLAPGLTWRCFATLNMTDRRYFKGAGETTPAAIRDLCTAKHQKNTAQLLVYQVVNLYL